MLVTLCLGLGLLVALPPHRAAAAPCDTPVLNAVACENTRTGSTDWAYTSPDSPTLQGFATDISVNKGSTITFKVDTTLTYTINIYRMGYYGGAGARKVATIANVAPTDQPACANDAATGLTDCGNWAKSASWKVEFTPNANDAVSGIYFAELRTSSARSHIVFVVRDDSSTSALYFQTSDTTWQAYNHYGGNSLYEGSPAGRAYKVSYNRPFDTNSGSTFHDFVWNAEYPMVRFLESNGYDVSYESGVDTDRSGSLLTKHKTFLSVGHDEYWSGQQRANVEAARDAGVNLAFFSGNEVFWKTRWEDNYRTLVTYKETHANAKIDPADPPTWTGTWRDPRFSPPADGGRPENKLTGTIFSVNCCTTEMHVGGADAKLRFWRNTKVAGLAATGTAILGHDILGYEWDESPDNGARPDGLIHLSTDTQNVSSYIQDYGTNYAGGTATHHLAMYRSKVSGALVFGAGSVQWSWGLDSTHWSDVSGATADTAVKQATVNLFADMAAQPATLQSGLMAATASTDTTPPSSTITSPAAGATVPVGQPLTIGGTATDTGGQVAGVEVSVDNGQSWHPATGRGSWSYSFTPSANTVLTVLSRATDDSARTETPGPGRTVTVGTGSQPPGTCPCTIWPSTVTPTVAADPDTAGTEVGVKFRTTKAGSVTGIRFYKGSGNSGTHVGSLWSATGAHLASVTFSGESATGWQQAQFGTPVAVSANTTYVASYFAPNGHYATSDGYFATAVTNDPLTALADGTDGANGVYTYAASSTFPNQAFQKSNYWVDVVFTDNSAPDTTPPTVTGQTPAANATGVSTGTAVSATFSEPVQAGTVTMALSSAGGAVTGTVAYDAASRTATFTPSAALAASTQYTATVSGAKDTAGNTMSAVSWGFTTAAADITPPTVTTRTPAPNATGVDIATSVTATFSEPVQSGTISMTLSGPGGSVTGTTAYDAASRTATFTPGSALVNSTTYTATVSGAKDTAGNAMAPLTWTFTTAAASSSGCPCTIWAPTATPTLAADPDTGGVEVGVKFRANQNGFVSGIRFYKSSTNTGTHTASLWSRTGTRLATASFSGETASGWQQVTFATPVAVTANTTYVASYFTAAGHYSVDENYFSTATTRGPLTALSNGTDGSNGVYRYGAASGFPNSSFRSSNYWVDVVFTTS